VRELLLQRGLELQERNFFKEPFSEAELQELAAAVGLSELLARHSPTLKRMGLAGQELSEAEMLRLMLQEPRLMRRPVVKIDGQLLVGANLKAVEAALGT
jgi:arsenate reductase-like glutaredoxin family protein